MSRQDIYYTIARRSAICRITAVIIKKECLKVRPLSSHPKPQFQVLKDFVEDQITNGTLRPGDRIPSEKELVKKFSVSRMTANRALSELAVEGAISRVQGLGSFVPLSRIESAALEIRDIAEEILEAGQAYSCAPLVVESGSLDEINGLLGLASGSNHFHAQLLHCADEIPIQLEDRWINPDFAPDFLDLDFTQTTPHRHLMSLGPLQAAEYVFDATLPTAQIAGYLKIPPGHACTELRRRTWSLNIVASYAVFTAPRERRQFHGSFGNLPSAAKRLPSP